MAGLALVEDQGDGRAVVFTPKGCVGEIPAVDERHLLSPLMGGVPRPQRIRR
jgi:hypothetical protein